MDAPEREPEAIRSFLHPAAGAFILGLDWLLFGGTAATGGAALALSVVLGFLIGGLGTGLIQRIVAKDRAGAALMKGLVAGIVVGLPFPIGGTIVGGAVLASSGLDQLKRRSARALLEGKTRPKDGGDSAP